jgi:hypothetical protein
MASSMGQVAAGGLPVRNREDHTISLPQAASTEVMRPERKPLADGTYENVGEGPLLGASRHQGSVRAGSILYRGNWGLTVGDSGFEPVTWALPSDQPALPQRVDRADEEEPNQTDCFVEAMTEHGRRPAAAPAPIFTAAGQPDPRGVLGFWHLPAFLLSGTEQRAWSFGPFVVGVLALLVLMTPMFNDARGSQRA